MSNNDYVIFIKKKRGDFEPVDSTETKDEGIESAKAYLDNPKVIEVEVVYMPEDDYDIEEVVWNSTRDLVKNTEEEEQAKEFYEVRFDEDANNLNDTFEDKEKAISYAKNNIEEGPVVYFIDSEGNEEEIWVVSDEEESNLIENTEEESAWSEEEVRAELIKMTNNFKKNEGEITTWYEEEKEHIKNILEAASYQVEVSDGRKDKADDMHWVITFVKKVNECLTENSNVKLALELIDNDEDNMVAAYKVSSGKDALSLAVETIGYESGFKVRKEDIKKLEVVSSLSEGNNISDVFIDIDDNKDLIYCGKFNSGDYTDVDKIIKVIEDWSKDVPVEESLKEDNKIPRNATKVRGVKTYGDDKGQSIEFTKDGSIWRGKDFNTDSRTLRKYYSDFEVVETDPNYKPKRTEEVYVVQGNYGNGWDDLTQSSSYKEAKADLKSYNENESYPHRLITRRVPVEESLKEGSRIGKTMSIDEIAKLCGGYEQVQDIVDGARENRPGIDCDELAEMTYHLCDSDEVSEKEWASLIEYVCSGLEESADTQEIHSHFMSGKFSDEEIVDELISAGMERRKAFDTVEKWSSNDIKSESLKEGYHLVEKDEVGSPAEEFSEYELTNLPLGTRVDLETMGEHTVTGYVLGPGYDENYVAIVFDEADRFNQDIRAEEVWIGNIVTVYNDDFEYFEDDEFEEDDDELEWDEEDDDIEESLKEGKVDNWDSTDSLSNDFKDKRVGYLLVVFNKQGEYGETIDAFDNVDDAIELADTDYKNAHTIVIRKEQYRGRLSVPYMMRENGVWSKISKNESLKESKITSLEDILNSPGSENIGNLELRLQKNGYKVISKKLVNSTNIGTSIPRYVNVYELILDNGKKVISVQHYDSNGLEDGFDNPKPYIKESLKESIDPIKSVLKDIDKAKKRLIGKSPVENFGQDEVRELRDKYFYYRYGQYSKVSDLINEFEDWCATYTGPARKSVYERVGSSHLNKKTEEDTNISIDKVEIEVDTLNTKTKKIDEDLAFNKDKKLTIREMYDFLLKSGMANGCDIILDWDNDSDLSDPKTAIEWLDLIIETYYDLDSDLRYMNANDEAERNMDQVIVPLEDFRNELNEKGLAQLNNIYYQVLSYNNDSGDDDSDDYDNYGAAEAAFENWVNDYKEDGVDGAVELLQVDDNNRTSKQLKYWSSEDDNAWKFDESLSKNCCNYQAAYEKLDKFMSDSEEDMYKFYEARTKEDLLDVLETAIIDEDRFLSYAGEHATLEGFAEYILDNKLNESMQEEETVKDYGCDMCGKRVPEDQIFWFYGGEIGLCEECYDKTSPYVRARLEDGDFSFLD